MNLNINYEKNLLLGIESVDVGFVATAVIRKFKSTEKKFERDFSKAARLFLIQLITKLFRACPRKYKLTVSLSS